MKKIVALMLVTVFAMTGFSSISYAECTGREKMKVKCKRKLRENKLVATMKKGDVGSMVTFTVTDDDGNVVAQEDRPVNGKGRARLRLRPIPDGHYTVTACDAADDTTCGD